MKNLIKKAGIERNKANTKHYDKAVIYSLRKRFYTILKLNNDVNNNIAEKLLGHKRGLEGTYLTPTREESFKEFKKAIADLTINPAKRQAKELELQQEKITELSSRDERLAELEKKLADYETITKETDMYRKKHPELGNMIEDYLNKELAKQLKKRLFKK